MYKTVVYTVKTGNFTKRDSQKILLVTAAVHFFKKICRIYKRTTILEFLCNKVTEHLPEFLLKKDPAQMFFLWNFQKNLLYTTPPSDYFWFVRLLPKNYIKMTTIEEIIVTLILALNVFLSFAITLEAVTQNNPTKSWRFTR